MSEFIKHWEAEKLMTNMLKEYERDVIEPRHAETQGDLAEIKALTQQGRGMLRLAGWVGTLAGIVWIVIQITQAVKR